MRKSSPSSTIFPERLQAAREKRDLSQGDLAKRAGFQASAISHFETGSRKPSFDNLRRLADALEVTTDYLLGRVEDTDSLADADILFRNLKLASADDRDFIKTYLETKENARRKGAKDEP